MLLLLLLMLARHLMSGVDLMTLPCDLLKMVVLTYHILFVVSLYIQPAAYKAAAGVVAEDAAE